MKANRMETMIARLGSLDEKSRQKLLAAIKHQALLEIRSALKHPGYSW